MNTKKIIIAGLAATIVYFLLGWLFYGILFTDIYQTSGEQNLLFVFLGCLVFSYLLAYILIHWAKVNSLIGGLKAGLLIGLANGLYMNFFMYSTQELNITSFSYDVIINTIIASISGAVIGMINKKG
jgi:hypothetical protein